MKKKLLLIAVCLITCIAAAIGIIRVLPDNEDNEKTTSLKAEELEFSAQYIRTNGHGEELSFPYTVIITSKEALNRYYEDNKDTFDLKSRQAPAADSSIGFQDAVADFDESYFNENALIFAVLQEGSGSVRHKVKWVKKDTDGALLVNISSITPEVGTCDMAQWHIIISVKKDNIPADKNAVLYLNDKLTEKSDSFEFSITWGCYGISSYDSKSGKLVKTSHASKPENYITTYFLTPGQKKHIYSLIEELDVMSYPDIYNPNEKLISSPSMTLILSVSTPDLQKTVTAKDIVLSFEADNNKGQKFLDVCREISNILAETEEWKALPDYEYYYD